MPDSPLSFRELLNRSGNDRRPTDFDLYVESAERVLQKVRETIADVNDESLSSLELEARFRRASAHLNE